MSPDTPNINVNSRVKPPSIFTIQELLLIPLNGLSIARAHKLIHCHQANLTTESRGSIFVIEVKLNIWRPNVQNKYTPPDYSINIDDGIFDIEFYSKPVFSPQKNLKKSQRDNLIPIKKDLHKKYHQKHLRIRPKLD